MTAPHGSVTWLAQIKESTSIAAYRKAKRDLAKPETQQIPVGQETWEVQFDPEKNLPGERLKGNPDFAVISKGERQPVAKIYMPPDPTKSLEIANQMNTQLENQVKPLREDLNTIRQVRQLLSTDSGAANQQVRDLLAGMFANNRATNLLYSKNATFGSLANRMASTVSQFTTGKFNEESRRQLREMIDEMENKVIAPTMRGYVSTFKQRAKTGNVNPDLIDVPETPSADESSNMPTDAVKAAEEYLKKFDK